MTTELTVEQRDRDAAADWFTLTNSLGIDHTGKAFEDALRDGSYDGDMHPLVQAFAKHRTEALAASDKGEVDIHHWRAELCRDLHIECGQISLHWAEQFLKKFIAALPASEGKKP